jgi:hypothetical protein
LGEGEPLFSGINLVELGFTPDRVVQGEHAMHVLIHRR